MGGFIYLQSGYRPGCAGQSAGAILQWCFASVAGRLANNSFHDNVWKRVGEREEVVDQREWKESDLCE